MDDDEKIEKNLDDNQSMDSSLIVFDPKVSTYNYTFKNLQRNKKYHYELHLFQRKVSYDDLQFIKTFHDNQLTFQTKEYDFRDRHFGYCDDYDTYGVCYWLGINYGKRTQ